MKKIFLLSALLFCVSSYAKELKVLAIGNSFSVCVTKNLPQITASVPGCRIILTSAYIGGCSLERHWNNIDQKEKKSDKTYAVSIFDSSDLKSSRKFRGRLSDLLQKNKYDVITIQQSSVNSIDYSTYQPYAANLITYIKKHQPQAEIVIQQTWSYRSDAVRLKKWNISNSEMFERLSDAYAKLAKENSFRIIPSGYAVQIFRAETPVKFIPVSDAALKKFKYPDCPSNDGDVAGMFLWKKNKKSGELKLVRDSNHLNRQGEYMQAVLWFSFLFEKPVSEIKYIPEGIDPEQAAFLRRCAQKAVDTFKQPSAE